MDRNSRQRIWKVEKLLSKAEEDVSIALKKRAERKEERIEFLQLRPKAMLHAIAVAAIAIYGQPRKDEPLVRAWARTLRRHQITIRNEYGREYQFEPGHEHEHKHDDDYMRELKAASHELKSIIMKGANETEKLTEIFRTAPIWLLEFTWMRLDASLLKFDLPEMSDKQVWGERGLRDMLRWPFLPLGIMTDGDLLSPADEEGSRQHRRISEFIKRRYPRCEPQANPLSNR